MKNSINGFTIIEGLVYLATVATVGLKIALEGGILK
jgi:hypothetical protein